MAQEFTRRSNLIGPGGIDFFSFEEMDTLVQGKVISNFPLEATLESILIGENTISSTGRSIVLNNEFTKNSLLPVVNGFKEQKILANQGDAGVLNPYATLSVSDLLFLPNDPVGVAIPEVLVNPIINFESSVNALFFGVIFMIGEEIPTGSFIKYIVRRANEAFDDYETSSEIFSNTSDKIEVTLPKDTLHTFWFNQPAQALEDEHFYTEVLLYKPDLEPTRLLFHARDGDLTRPYGINIVRLSEDVEIALKKDLEYKSIDDTTTGNDLIIKSGNNLIVDASSDTINFTVNMVDGWYCRILDFANTFGNNDVRVDIGTDTLVLDANSKRQENLLIRSGNTVRVYDGEGKFQFEGDI